MDKKKSKAIKLRKQGKSYKEIHTSLKIPKSTLSLWLGREAWSKEISATLARANRSARIARLRKLNRSRGKRLAEAYAEAEAEAREEFTELKNDPLFIAGVMLYWGIGSRHPRQGVKFSNSDPKMVRLYAAFLTDACRIPTEHVRAYAHIYPAIDERTARAYWAKAVGLPWECFTGSIVLKGRKAGKRLSWGMCTISVSSTYFKRKMLAWITLFEKELLKAP